MGKCSVTINSNSAGVFTANASVTIVVGGVNGVQFMLSTNGMSGNSGPAVKTYVDANITITPPNATNKVNDPHAFTVTVMKNPGTGFVAAAGEHVDFTLTDANGAVSILDAAASTCDDPGANTNASGQCTIVFTSATAGTTTGNASVTLTVGGISLTRDTDPATSPTAGSGGSGPAIKTWTAGALFLIIDEDSIDNGIRFFEGPIIGQQNIVPETLRVFSDLEVNDQIASYTQRNTLQYFATHVGDTIALMTGQTGDEGWFAPNCVPLKWNLSNSRTNNNCAVEGSTDFITGLFNFFAGTVPQNRLDNIRDVRPLRGLGLEMLEGQTVCALVYDSDISINYRTTAPFQIGNLQGATLGIVAFTVLDNGVNQMLRFSSSTLPEAQIRIENAGDKCGASKLFGAPIPKSSSVPNDIDPHSAADDDYRPPVPPLPPIP